MGQRDETRRSVWDKINQSHCRIEVGRQDRGARTLARRWDGVRFRTRVREKEGISKGQQSRAGARVSIEQ